MGHQSEQTCAAPAGLTAPWLTRPLTFRVRPLPLPEGSPCVRLEYFGLQVRLTATPSFGGFPRNIPPPPPSRLAPYERSFQRGRYPAAIRGRYCTCIGVSQMHGFAGLVFARAIRAPLGEGDFRGGLQRNI